MEQKIKQLRRTIGLLSSMVYSGEKHSKDSERSVRNALSALDDMPSFEGLKGYMEAKVLREKKSEASTVIKSEESELKFLGTKGEWHYVEFAGFFAIQDGPNYQDLDIMDASFSNHSTVTANAKLITAAPDLLKACQEFVRKVDYSAVQDKVSYGMMMRAITKALK